ncbi:hypothetical protein DFH94DRAFT_291122 [Russula ochroleuca]|uniref:DUF6593 domain-containing protein n=1 Tax=Russula ochroleuca TaxID=152965 RepID=A0A9P5JXH4_9AGAM|nr:hypothetical protein DFH94DRAFT_291122 [Russula ochroleuca]
MAAASDTTQVSADKYLPHRPPSPTTSLATSLSPTLVDKSSYTEHPRPSLKLTIPIMIPGDSPYIINMVDFKVFNTPNWYKYYVFSSSNQTALFSCTDRVDVATVQWDRRPSPRMVFHRKKIKCKAWLPLTSTGPQKDSESRTFTHRDAKFTWTQGRSSGHLIPAYRPDLSVAQWYIDLHTDQPILEIFQESPIESDLFDAIVLSVVLLRSGRSLGDSPEISFCRIRGPLQNLLAEMGGEEVGLARTPRSGRGKRKGTRK